MSKTFLTKVLCAWNHSEQSSHATVVRFHGHFLSTVFPFARRNFSDDCLAVNILISLLSFPSPFYLNAFAHSLYMPSFPPTHATLFPFSFLASVFSTFSLVFRPLKFFSLFSYFFPLTTISLPSFFLFSLSFFLLP